MMRPRLAAYVLSIALIPEAFAAAINDFEPADGPAGGWNAVNTTTSFYRLVNGDVSMLTLKVVTVNAGLIAAHDHTKKPNNLNHVHMQRDFTAAEQGQVNAFWDWYFDAPAKTTNTTGAAGVTNKTNCYCTALGSLGNGGSYAYWLDTADADTGFTDDTTAVVVADAQNGDLLYYKSQNHASILATITKGEGGGQTYTIKWKNNASAVYQYTMATALDTPGMTKWHLEI